MNTLLIALAIGGFLCLIILSICIAAAKPEEDLWPNGEEPEDRVVTAGKKPSQRAP